MFIPQLINVESLSNLFLDVRVNINNREIIVFYLTSAPFSIHYPSRSVKLINLNNRENVKRYQALTLKGQLIGNHVRRYGSVMIAYLLDRLNHRPMINANQINHFSKHLFYLSCTRRPAFSALNRYSSARQLREKLRLNHQLIDLQDLNVRHVKVTAAKRGLAIHYLPPMNQVTSQKDLDQFIKDCVGKAVTMKQLIQMPKYQEALQCLNHPDSREVNYAVPGVTQNYLDAVLTWIRNLNPSATRYFLPIYSALKNLQGINRYKVKTNPLKGTNLNLPYVKANGLPTALWMNMGRYFHDVNVNWRKFQKLHTDLRKLFKKSSQSGNWLIDRRYRLPSQAGKFIINLDPLRHSLFIQLNAVNAHVNQSTSANVIWHLMIWQMGEIVTLHGGLIQSVTNRTLQVSNVTKDQLLRIIKSHFKFLFVPKLNLKSLIKTHRLSEPTLMNRLVIKRKQLLNPQHFTEALRLFQIIPQVGRWSHQTLFTIQGHAIHNQGTVTRIFLVKPGPKSSMIKVARVTQANWYRYNNDERYHNQVIHKVEQAHLNGTVRPLRHLKASQQVYLNCQSLTNFTSQELNYLYHHLDLKAYLKLLKSTES